MSIVYVDKLVRYYGRHRALDNVSFSMNQGEIIGVLGLNGAGKTTCLRILAGLLTPSSGQVRINDKDMLDDPIGVRQEIGFLPEEPPLYRDMSVESFLQHVGRLRGMSLAEVKRRIPEVCERTGLSTANRERIISELSHGYRKRVGIAQAILHNPNLVILDEPISGLDPAQIVEMRRTVRSLKTQHSVMISSHILTEISQTCDRILVFHEGRLVAEGSEYDLKGRAGNRYNLTIRGDKEKLENALSRNKMLSKFRLEHHSEGIILADLCFSHRGSSHNPDPGESKSVGNVGDDLIEDLVSALMKEGFGIRRVVEAQGELETLFLDLTADSMENKATSSASMNPAPL